MSSTVRQAGVIGLALFAMGLVLGGGHAQLTVTPEETGTTCRQPAKPLARLELLFGTSRLERAPVDETEWTTFLDDEVTPRFPGGLTVLSGPGQWRGKDGQVEKERSFMLIVWYERTPVTDAHIEAIRSAYKARFGQDSVMRVDGASCVSF
jgi:hypothetical protein